VTGKRIADFTRLRWKPLTGSEGSNVRLALRWVATTLSASLPLTRKFWQKFQAEYVTSGLVQT
jgi:hypothetical protein